MPLNDRSALPDDLEQAVLVGAHGARLSATPVLSLLLVANWWMCRRSR
ncbi:hypothetical protein OKW41_003116 [Paraburkholderia sp. UCT70]